MKYRRKNQFSDNKQIAHSEMNGSRDHHVKQNQPGSEGQMSYAFSHVHNLDQSRSKIYLHMYIHINR
jgi:hypothetical protein